MSKRKSTETQNGYHHGGEGVDLKSKKASYDKNDLSEAQLRSLPDPEPSPPKSGWKIHVSRPFVPEKAEQKVVDNIRKGLISSATEPVREFERELKKIYKAGWAKGCSNGYSALVLALKNARIGPGDEVIIPSLTMAAVVTSVRDVGAKPVFVDCERQEDRTLFLNPSVDQYRLALTERTKAIIVTHTYGVPVDCLALQSLCREKNITFIEDIAEAIGTQYMSKYVGTFGHYATASLYANKSITAGDGGFILSAEGTEEGKKLVDAHTNHGFTPGHHFVHWEFSGNYKMSGLAAAFVTPAVEKIPVVMEDRQRIATEYRRHLTGVPGLTAMEVNPYGPDCPWVFGVTVESKAIRTTVRHKMATDGIETRDYFFPLHLQPCVVGEFGEQPTLPNAEELGRTGFYLPTFYGLTNTDITYISSSLKGALVSAKQSP